jgi:hypothetical protein
MSGPQETQSIGSGLEETGQFATRIREMVAAVERGDGSGVRACFAEGGVYHDVFYGAFKGDDITSLINDYFWRDATDFRWDIHDPVAAGGIGYARYIFSYRPTLQGVGEGRAIFEGVAICRMREGLIDEYREVARESVALAAMDFAPERIAKYLSKQNRELRSRTEAARHLD